MPRAPRIARAGLIYHITHRGNRRGDVFFSRVDREEYLRRLAGASRRHGLQIWNWCLMSNHVHLQARSLLPDSMANTMREVQGRYALATNRRCLWSGHLWANRHYSHPIDPEAAWVVARYIERNPVRAGLCERAEQYAWSSARAHCGLEGAGILSPERPFPGVVGDWSSWLEGHCGPAERQVRASARAGVPFGREAFRRELELAIGRPLELRPVGRPRRDSSKG